MYKFYIEQINQNEATNYYISIVKRSIEQIGEEVVSISSVKNILPGDKIFVVSLKTFFYVWLKCRNQHIVTWYQGVSPEEAMCDSDHTYIFKICRKILLTLIEKLALRRSWKNLFVSKAMCEHYKMKYGYSKNNFFVMPCFNQELDVDGIKNKRYDELSFVYAGSLSKWQCIDNTLLLYKRIHTLYPSSSLTLLTKDKVKAEILCDKYHVSATIKFVPLETLQEELLHYKYGFIVREDMVVNNVATPTKMNSYIASGVIPIFSDVIHDFKDCFKDVQYTIPFSTFDECLEKIKIIEGKTLSCKDIIQEYSKVFESYYSTQKYIKQLSGFLSA